MKSTAIMTTLALLALTAPVAAGEAANSRSICAPATEVSPKVTGAFAILAGIPGETHVTALQTAEMQKLRGAYASQRGELIGILSWSVDGSSYKIKSY